MASQFSTSEAAAVSNSDRLAQRNRSRPAATEQQASVAEGACASPLGGRFQAINQAVPGKDMPDSRAYWLPGYGRLRAAKANPAICCAASAVQVFVGRTPRLAIACRCGCSSMTMVRARATRSASRAGLYRFAGARLGAPAFRLSCTYACVGSCGPRSRRRTSRIVSRKPRHAIL